MNLSPMPLAVLVVDAAGIVTSWNKACEKLAGYGAAEIQGMPLLHIVEFADPPDAQPQLAARAEAESDAVLKCADGRRLPVRVMVAPRALEPGPASSFSVIVIPQPGQFPARYALIQDLPVADIVEALPCVFYVIDPSGHLLLWNRLLEEALEMPADELPTAKVEGFFDARDREVVVDNIRRAFEHGHSTHEAVLVGKHGKRTSLLFQCARTTLGNVPVVFGTGLDITVRKQAEHGLQVRERAIYSSLNAIVITRCEEHEHRIEYVNPAFERITGYTLAEIKGRDPRFMRLDGCDEDERQRIRMALKRNESVRAVLRNLRKNGEIFWNDLRIDPVVNLDGEISHFVGVINDITEARHYERRLHHLAHHDPLTGLANRTLLQERLRQALEGAAQKGTTLALAFLDLDNFKHINDHFGHDAGDAVLREVAQRLRAGMREDDLVARMGGDEFVLLLCDPTSRAQLADLVERIRLAIMAPLRVDGQEILPGTSIGVALFPDDGDTPEQMMRAADAAMYHAKTMGKNNVQFHSAELNQIVHAYLMLEANLGRAIRERELVLDYQPKVDLRSGRVVGAEALVRWRHPVEGTIPPDRFIPVAEETGLIVPLGEWVIEETCVALKSMAAHGLDDFVIAVNLSARQLRQRQFPERLGQTLRRYGVDPRRLELEVTESQLMDQPDEARDALAQLKALGVRLSIDDFGTGYSSLSHLQTFPVDYIKIDRSFLGDVGHDGHMVITRAIIALGHNLKLQVIAEGVETREQLAFLRAHDCDQMQGYYFSPALSRDALQDLLARDTRLPD
ncbi:EAL domain-containing protein [Massilia oculi]|uniref:EAL domain-containing protein n=1 Tax=Massilia hydrophila TaxID=3044279 RepID=A0ABS7Y4Z1_9BURK|nr:bifunctional diguanylate cyclase/phosphodiesterase [Massilia oculi]MCA1854755.1 EAL domain-containing protein [Massilia oculi]